MKTKNWGLIRMKQKTKAHNVTRFGQVLAEKTCPFCGARHMRADGDYFICTVCDCSFRNMPKTFLSHMRTK